MDGYMSEWVAGAKVSEWVNWSMGGQVGVCLLV